jgi:SAM-dependent methyltransferase
MNTEVNVETPAAPEPTRPRSEDPLVATLRMREIFRDRYWREHDPIVGDRLLWRAQSVRHTVHLLPGQTILELGAGCGRFTRVLARITRGENPIVGARFHTDEHTTDAPTCAVEAIELTALPGPLAGRRFDCVVAMDLLDREDASELLQVIHDLLEPGGEVIFYESNPWNPVLKLRRALGRLAGRRDPRRLLSRPHLYELLSEIGFIRVYAVYNDFVFAPLTRGLVWWLRNLSILLENAPVVSRMAGSILLHAQKPPRKRALPPVSLCAHEGLRGAVSVVIPCRNEDMNVRPLVENILRLYGEYVHEIIPVNDGSTDNTAAVLDQLAREDARVRPLHRPPPNGVGRAIRDGLGAASGRYVLTMDCDFQHLLPEFRDLFDAAERGYDVVIGSRFSRHSVLLNYPFMKIVANRGFHFIARWTLGWSFRDVTNNLKLFRREVVNDLVLLQPGFAVNAETGIQPWLLGYKVREIPISWINRTPGMGASSFRLVRVGGGYWQVLLGLWLRCTFRRGPYRSLRRPAGPGAGMPASAPATPK